MPIFTRFCPVDWHTCSRRECQDPADCQYPPQPNSDPQKAWDEMHPPIPKPENDYMCFGPADRAWQRFLDVLTGMRPSSECPTLEELQL